MNWKRFTSAQTGFIPFGAWDMRYTLSGELWDLDRFIQFGLTRVTIEWANGADLAPEFLYEIGQPVALQIDDL